MSEDTPGRPAAGRAPLERDRKGHRILRHGLSGYARGCRCGACMERGGVSGITHGLNANGSPSGYAQGCRCGICRAAKRDYERGRSAAREPGPAVPSMDAGDARGRSPVGVPLSGHEKALIDQVRGRMDPVPARSALLRDVILGWLEQQTGYVDTARRSAPRRENRQRGEGQ